MRWRRRWSAAPPGSGLRAGLTAAAAFLVCTAVLAVVAEAAILVVARASPRRRLLADVTPAYVASLTLRPYQLDGRPAFYAANYTTWPRGHGHGAQLRDRLCRLASAEHRPAVITPANPTLAAKLHPGFTPLPGEESARRPRIGLATAGLELMGPVRQPESIMVQGMSYV